MSDPNSKFTTADKENAMNKNDENLHFPSATDRQHEKPSHSFLGILSCLFPIAILSYVILNITGILDLNISEVFGMGFRHFDVLFGYCIAPVFLLIGLRLALVELKQKNRKNLFPLLGLLLVLAAFAPILLMWMLGLLVGAPFSCFDRPGWC